MATIKKKKKSELAHEVTCHHLIHIPGWKEISLNTGEFCNYINQLLFYCRNITVTLHSPVPECLTGPYFYMCFAMLCFAFSILSCEILSGSRNLPSFPEGSSSLTASSDLIFFQLKAKLCPVLGNIHKVILHFPPS